MPLNAFIPSGPRLIARARTLSLTRPDGLSLHGYRWPAEGEPRLHVLLGHSQVVHCGQIAPLAEALARQGCEVVAFDMRGHGRSTNRANPPMHLAQADGWEVVLQDFLATADLAFDGVPIARRLLLLPNVLALVALDALKRRPDLAGQIVLMAPPPNQVMIGKLGATFAAARARLRDPASPDDHILHHVYTYLGSHLPERQHLLDVVSPDPAVISRILADPLCWRVPTTAYWQNVFRGLSSAWTFPRGLRVDPATRFLILYGEEDPMTRNGAYCQSMLKALSRLGPAEASARGIKGARSGLFMEEERLGIAGQILSWVTSEDRDVALPPVEARELVSAEDRNAPLSPAEFLALCYAGVQDESRWVELMLRIMVSMNDRQAGDFDRLVMEMMPYWDQAFSLHQQLLTSAALGEVWADILERIGMGCAIVDRRGVILHRNAGYDAALTSAIEAAGGADDAGGAERLTEALLRTLPEDHSASGAVLSWQDAPVGIFLQPPSLARHARQLGSPMGVICIRQAEDMMDLASLFGVAWGLSQQEARTAVEVMQGRAPAEIAEAFGVSINTVRSHLARCYAKTGTTGQTELAAYLNRSPLAWFGQAAGEGGPPALPGRSL